MTQAERLWSAIGGLRTNALDVGEGHGGPGNNLSKQERVDAWPALQPVIERPHVVDLEDLWLEEQGVNLPGTSSSVRPNWQRPMSRLLDDIISDPLVNDVLLRLGAARGADASAVPPSPA